MERLTYILIIIGCVIISAFFGYDFFYQRHDVMNISWKYYKKTFISQDGRVNDFQRDNTTSSEGQSYAMIRALMTNDRENFDKTYKWANENLKHKKDHLYSWFWGKSKDGTWRVLDQNTASDADIDISTALIMASVKWKDKAYLAEAKKIISDIWNHETRLIKSQRILTAGQKQCKCQDIDINPSYFSPYAFRLFSKYDKKHNWAELVDSSYDMINKIAAKTETGLIPDWFSINSETGEIFLDKEDKKSDFSYDAVRSFLRIYVDYVVYKDPRAKKFLAKVKFFTESYTLNPKDGFLTNFRENGLIRDKFEYPASIAMILPAVKIFDKKLAKDIYATKVYAKFKKEGYWSEPKNYYMQNLAWIGTWVYLNKKRLVDSF